MNERQAQLDWIYEAIGGGELQCTDAVMARINELEGGKSILTPLTEPLTFNEWCSEADIEREYERFHDEYGDAAALLSDYKEYHYQAYLERFKIHGKFCSIFA
jgi:hypothetical protein